MRMAPSRFLFLFDPRPKQAFRPGPIQMPSPWTERNIIYELNIINFFYSAEAFLKINKIKWIRLKLEKWGKLGRFF